MNLVQRLSEYPTKIIVIHVDPEGSGQAEYSWADEWRGPEDIPSHTELPKPVVGSRKKQPRTLVILDEMPWARIDRDNMAKLFSLVNFASTHRNTSVIIQTQNYTQAPEPVRSAMAITILCGPIQNRITRGILGTRLGCEPGEICEAQGLMRSRYDTLTARAEVDPDQRWSLNLWQPVHRRTDLPDEEHSIPSTDVFVADEPKIAEAAPPPAD